MRPTSAPAPVLPPLDGQLCFKLYSASLAVTRLYKPVLDRLGLTYPQYILLVALWEEDGLGIGTIAERLFLDPSTVTPLAKRLEGAGLVERVRDPADERRVTVRLTPEGRALEEDCQCLAVAISTRAGMTVADLVDLTGRVTRLRDALTTEPEPEPEAT